MAGFFVDIENYSAMYLIKSPCSKRHIAELVWASGVYVSTEDVSLTLNGCRALNSVP